MPNALTDDFTADDSPADEPELEQQGGEQESGEQDAAPTEEKQAKLTPITSGRRGRAAAAQEALMNELKGLRETFSKQGETYQQEMARIARENAELRGLVHGSMAQRQQAERPRDPEPNADDLMEQANKALDAKDFSGYQKLYAKAIRAQVLGEVRGMIPQQQSSQPQVHPMLQVVAGQYADVVSDPYAMDLAKAKDNQLARSGMPDGPERWRLALEEGRRVLSSGKKQPAQFSSKTRDVLSGVPTQRGNGQGNGEARSGVRLTQQELSYAKKFKMSVDEYAQHLAAMHPERVESE